MSKVYVFPGQGSQEVGMGGDLFDKFPELFHVVDTLGLDEIAPSVYFLCQAVYPPFERICKGVGCRTDKHFGGSMKICAA